MVALAIIAILGALAVPTYQDYILRGYFADATSDLAQMAARLESQYLNNRSYAGPAGGCNIDLQNTAYFTYTCDLSQNGQAFTLTATSTDRVNIDGGVAFTLDHNGNRSSLIGSDSGNTNPCWIFDKEGNCL